MSSKLAILVQVQLRLPTQHRENPKLQDGKEIKGINASVESSFISMSEQGRASKCLPTISTIIGHPKQSQYAFSPVWKEQKGWAGDLKGLLFAYWPDNLHCLHYLCSMRLLLVLAEGLILVMTNIFSLEVCFFLITHLKVIKSFPIRPNWDILTSLGICHKTLSLDFFFKTFNQLQAF